MNWAYVAGYFDGEGSIVNRAFPGRGFRIGFYNSHRPSLEAIRQFIGVGKIRARPTPKGKPFWALEVSGHENIRRVAKAMLPYAIIKRERLQTAIESIESHPWTNHLPENRAILQHLPSTTNLLMRTFRVTRSAVLVKMYDLRRLGFVSSVKVPRPVGNGSLKEGHWTHEWRKLP